MKKCVDPEIGKFLKAFCLGEVLTDQDRKKFEIHLLECGYCWQELRKLGWPEPPQTDKL